MRNLLPVLALLLLGSTAWSENQEEKKGKVPDKFLKVLQGVPDKKNVGLLFLGDSITAGWGRNNLKDMWAEAFGRYRPANLGVPGYGTGHLVQYIEAGALDDFRPKVVVVLIGTNNTNGMKQPAEAIAADHRRIVEGLRRHLPETKILLLGIFPRGPQKERGETEEKHGRARMAIIRVVNKSSADLDNGKTVRFLDLGDHFLVAGRIPDDIMADQLHLTTKGYTIWKTNMLPLLEDMMR